MVLKPGKEAHNFNPKVGRGRQISVSSRTTRTTQHYGFVLFFKKEEEEYEVFPDVSLPSLNAYVSRNADLGLLKYQQIHSPRNGRSN